MLSYWHRALSRARTDAALLSLCNEFLASWTAEQLAELPEGCRPSRVDEPAEIQAWIGTLSEALCESQEEPAADALRYMLQFLFLASDRAMEMAADAGGCASETVDRVTAQ